MRRAVGEKDSYEVTNVVSSSPRRNPVAHRAITFPMTYSTANAVIFLAVGPPIRVKVPYRN